jgi:2'-5' RNA ligase
MPEPYRTREGVALWDKIHADRSRAFGPGGEGWEDVPNAVEKYLDQHPSHLLDKLRGLKFAMGTVRDTRNVTAAVRHVDSNQSDGLMVAIVPPDEVLSHLEQVMRPLDQHEPEPREQLHVTVLYLGKMSEHTDAEIEKLPQLIRLWALTAEPFTAKLQGSGTFASAEKHPLVALVDIPGEARHLHKSLSDFLKGHGYKFPEDHSWIPHVTLAYSPYHVRFLPKVTPVSWPVSEVWLARGKEWTSYPLGRT